MSYQSKFVEHLDDDDEPRPRSPQISEKENNAKIQGSFWSRAKDRWAFVSFLVSLSIYTTLSAYSIYMLIADYDDLTDITVPSDVDVIFDSSSRKRKKRDTIDFDAAFNEETGWIFAGATVMSVGLSLALLFFIRKFPTIVVMMGPCFAMVYLFGSAAGCAYLGIWSEAALMAAVGALLLLSLFLMKNRYRLARDLLDTANMAAQKHWSVFWTVLVGILVQWINSIWNIATFIAVFLAFEPWHQGCDDSYFCSATVTWILLTFVIMEYMWVSSVINSITLAVMAGGPYANWWYGTDLDTRSESMWALKRAIGTSLGSIAFGSLLVTAIEILHFIVKLLSGGHSNGGAGGCCSLCCRCILTIIEKWLTIFNKYVYIRIGVDKFEIGFIQGGKEVWRLFKKGKGFRRQGLAAMVNDSLVGLALHFTCVGNAVLCAGVTYVYMTVIDGSLDIDHWWDWLILLYAFVLSLNIGLALTSALEAGVSTIFVCLDKNPEKLEMHNKRFYDDLCRDEKYFQAVMLGASRPLPPAGKA